MANSIMKGSARTKNVGRWGVIESWEAFPEVGVRYDAR
jgi:hypothetical protein